MDIRGVNAGVKICSYGTTCNAEFIPSAVQHIVEKSGKIIHALTLCTAVFLKCDYRNYQNIKPWITALFVL